MSPLRPRYDDPKFRVVRVKDKHTEIRSMNRIQTELKEQTFYLHYYRGWSIPDNVSNLLNYMEFTETSVRCTIHEFSQSILILNRTSRHPVSPGDGVRTTRKGKTLCNGV